MPKDFPPFAKAAIRYSLAAAFVCALPLVSAQAGETAVTCTNPSSGAQWQIKIDYDKRTVDSYPAKITAAEIAWHSGADNGNYTLDRKSGKLTMVAASSTGGYFLFDRCELGH